MGLLLFEFVFFSFFSFILLYFENISCKIVLIRLAKED